MENLTSGQKRSLTEQAKHRRFFEGKVWDIIDEVHLPPGQVFKTPFGRRARHGWILRERTTGEQIAVGYTLLRYIHYKHLGVTLPPRIEMHRRQHVDAV